MVKAFVCGCSSFVFTKEEVIFLEKEKPWGLILFRRNIDTPSQVQALTQNFRQIVGRDDAPVFVDQEGGKVQRLGPPYWPIYPSAASFYDLYMRSPLEGISELRKISMQMASDLKAVGITVACLPVLDVPSLGSHLVIGDRAYGSDPEKVTLLSSVVMEAFLQVGVTPVIKHIPGHGRAQVDSHSALPYVTTPLDILERIDFLPFAFHAGAPLAMTAHVVFTALDGAACCTFSPIVIKYIRKKIGFSGVLLSDDLSMGALSGSLYERAIKAKEAGCDILLHCNGILEEMEQVARAAPPWRLP